MSASEILVTGGTGSLGRRVVNHLRGPGYEVRTLSRSARGAGVVRGDLRTGEGLAQALEGVDVLIHCASSHALSIPAAPVAEEWEYPPNRHARSVQAVCVRCAWSTPAGDGRLSADKELLERRREWE